jgi:alpha-glucosidase
MPVTDVLQTSLVHPAHGPGAEWWRQAVIYQIYPRSWADSNGDGIGDLPAVTERLGYLKALGVDAIWFSPFFTSPQADAGYDVADYRDIDPLFGDLAAADRMVERAHQLGLKVVVDLVPNHSSDEHPWFQAALAAGPGSPERERYLFRDGRGADGSEPPNDWRSVFGGTAWTRVTEADGSPGQWYLHLFDSKQPDFNWSNPQVREEFLSILRFWLDRGVDGFRVDVAHGLVKRDGLPDWSKEQELIPERFTGAAPMWDQDGVHDIYREWRAVLDSYGKPDRMMCAEAWVKPTERLVRYVREDEFNQAFNFDFLDCPWEAERLREVIEASLRSADGVGAPSTWVLSNHDVVRHASRLGLPVGDRRPNGIGVDDPQPDRELGLKRARAATAVMLALPGSAYLYQGEELGLPDSTEVPHHYRQDPTFHRTSGTELGRDGCRIPFPWKKDAPAFGFGPSAETWLPQPAIYGEYAVDQQEGVEGSTLELYRSLLSSRRALGLGLGDLDWLKEYAGDVVAFRNAGPLGSADETATVVVANLGSEPVPLPAGARVLVASGPLTDEGLIPTDTTVWAHVD